MRDKFVVSCQAIMHQLVYIFALYHRLSQNVQACSRSIYSFLGVFELNL